MPLLADQLASLANPKPVDFDPETVDLADGERGSNSGSENESDDEKLARDHYVTVGKSKLRTDDVQMDNVKYKGSRVSRQALYEEEEQEEETSDREGQEHDSRSDDEYKDAEMDSEDAVELGDAHNKPDENESESDGEDVNQNRASTEERDRDKLRVLMDNEQKLLLSRLSSSARADAEKGRAVQQQMNIYEGLLDSRITIQKAISSVNTLPIDKSSASTFESEGTDRLRQDATEALLDLADTISTLRLKLMKNDSFANEVKLGQKRTLEDGFNNLRALDAALEAHGGTILTKWSRKVNASSGSSALQAAKFKSLNQTAEIQVRSMLADMERLVKRTRLNRSNVTILGQDLSVSHQNGSNHLVENDHIFDDTDFYRLLLKDLVDKRMADSGAATGLKWTAVKTKVKKNVDTKASKGRRLRYHVQEKIQGFDVPRPVFTWTDDQIDDLFISLLGQKVKLDENLSSESEESEPDNDGLAIFG